MTSQLRVLIAFVIALIVALPIVSSDGGEGGGGTGIWILPRATFLGAGLATSPVDHKSLATLNNDLVMQVSAECGACAATSIDEVSGMPVSLPVLGSRIRLPATLLQALAATGAKANIVIMDSSGLGYSLSVTASSTNGLLVNLY